MKKLLISMLMIAGSIGFASAQAKQKVETHKATSKSTTLKSVPTTTTTTAPVVKMNEKKSTATTIHTKADGTADKRFKENKTTTVKSAGPLKKNGTPDMRYNANKKK